MSKHIKEVQDRLLKYKSMRSSEKTPEPFGDKSLQGKPSSNLHFVVQKHRATALHYDFRLEYCGVMASWAIPKGPTLDPAVRRLAMQTEDHPLDYRHFEGSIPKGEYGGGEVIIWDEGTYYPELEESRNDLSKTQGRTLIKRVQIKDKKEAEKVILEGLEKGEIKFYLEGKRLKGSFALVRTKGFPFVKTQGKPSGRKNAWLLIKHRDEFVKEDYDAGDLVASVVSERNLI